MAAGLISGLEIKYPSALLQCGFFKRATKDQYNAAYHKAEVHVQPSDERSDEAWFILSDWGKVGMKRDYYCSC